MSRTIRLLTCLLLLLTLATAPAVFASPPDGAPTPWSTVLSNLWSSVTQVVFGAEDPGHMSPTVDANGLSVDPNADGDAAPEIDPDGDAFTNSEGQGNRGPEIDPDG